MKIAIVTVYDSIVNYGSFLQAYALNKILQDMGHQVSFIRRMPDEEIIERFDNIAWDNINSRKIENWEIPKKFFRYLKVLYQRRLNKKRFIFAKVDWKYLDVISCKEFLTQKFDLIICGSDEIWNLHNKDVDIDFYTCKNIKNIPKLAYGISIGNCKLEEYNIETINAIKDFLIVYPRDNNTKKVLENIKRTECELVCDPTILWGKENYDVHNINKYGKYMLVYAYVLTKKQKKILKDYARMHNLAIVSPCISCDIANYNINSSALEFPSLIQNADCMYTSTFHGTIFGLMYAPKLCINPRLGKIKDLVNSLGVQAFTVNDDSSFNDYLNIFSKDFNYASVSNRFDEMRVKSKEKLLSGLRKVQKDINV